MTKQTEQGAAEPTDVELLLFAGGHEDPNDAPASSWQFDNDELVRLLRGVIERFGQAKIPSTEGCALENRDLPNFDPADLTIDSFPRRPPGGMQVGMSVGVVVRHKPSGFSVIVDNHRSQHRNRDEALRQLAFLVHVFGDMPAATAGGGNGSS
jgi:hypothetical protein